MGNNIFPVISKEYKLKLSSIYFLFCLNCSISLLISDKISYKNFPFILYSLDINEL